MFWRFYTYLLELRLDIIIIVIYMALCSDIRREGEKNVRVIKDTTYLLLELFS